MKNLMADLMRRKKLKVQATAEKNKEELSQEVSEMKKSQPHEIKKSQEPTVVKNSDKSILGL